MFLTVHATAGAAIGAFVGDPLSGFALGVVSHFILDIIPHGDEALGPECGGPLCAHREEIRFLLRLAMIDAIIMTAVLAALMYPWDTLPTRGVLAGIAGGVVPDLLQGFSVLVPRNRTLKRYKDFHDFLHVRVIRYECSVFIGMIGQVVMLVVMARAYVVLS